MNRIVINLDPQGGIELFSDEAVQIFTVCDHIPADRVFEMDVTVGVEHVRAQLQDDPVEHSHDDTCLGDGYEPRKTSKRKLQVIDGGAV